MTPSELQLKIDRIIDRGFKPTRKQKISSILLIVHSLEFESVLAHALKISFKQSDINDVADTDLDELFQWHEPGDTKLIVEGNKKTEV